MSEGSATGSSTTTKVRRLHRNSILILVAAILIYTVYWSIISLLKFYYFQATIFDLGVLSQSLWNVPHTNWTFGTFTFEFLYSGIVYLLFPLQYGGYSALLIFQAFFLSLGSVFLFFIGINSRLTEKSSIIISLSYLLYFPLSGMNWFDFHFQSLFPTLFLAAFLLFQRKRELSASVLFFISGLVRFPYAVLPLLFWISTLLFETRTPKDQRRLLLIIINIAVYTLFLFVSYLSLKNGYIQTHSTGNGWPFTDLPIKFLTLILILAPVLFLPLFSKRWALLFLPFVGLMFIANSPVYEYPNLFQLQYSASYIPFVFLATIDAMANQRVSRIVKTINSHINKKSKPRLLNVKNGKTNRIVVTILVASLIGGVGYQFASPIHILNESGINFNTATHFSGVQMRQFFSVARLVPRDDPYVLLQNNLPQYLPAASGENVIMAGFVGPTIAPQDVENNSFHWVYGSFEKTLPIDYVLLDLNSTDWVYKTMQPSFPNLADISYVLLKSGYYGIEAQAGPFVVIKRGYASNSNLLSPFIKTLGGSSFGSRNQTLNDFLNSSGNSNLYTRSVGGFPLPPGNYTLTLRLSSSEPLYDNLSFGLLSTIPITQQITNLLIFKVNSNNESIYTCSFQVQIIGSNLDAYVTCNHTSTFSQIQSLTIQQNSL